MMCHQNRLKRSFLNSNSRSISMPGLPRKVGKSGDMVWVRSTTLLKLLVSAAGAGTAVAANPAAAAPVKKPRLLKAARTFASQPATHIFSPFHRILICARLSLSNVALATGALTQAMVGARRPIRRFPGGGRTDAAHSLGD